MGGLLGYFTRHPTAANLLLVMLVVLGLAAAPQMRVQFFPDVVSDEVRVVVQWDGAGPEDIDRAIIAPMMPALMAVEGVSGSWAVAREGRADMELQFEPGWTMQRALVDVQSAVDAMTTLPEEVDPPEVKLSAWRDRVTDVIITGPVGVDQLARFADDLTARLFDAGVTRTTIRGVAAPETVVEVRTLDLMRHDVTMAEIAAAVGDAADSRPAGDIAGANARIRTGAERRAADDVAAVPLRVAADSSVLRVGDVARVYDSPLDRTRAYFVGENPALSVRIDRSPDGDAVAIQRTVETVARDLMEVLPPEVQVDLIRTRAAAISERLDLLIDNGLMGLGLVVGLLFFFLNARTAFWVAAGVPAAMIAALGLMYVGGLTLNMISLFGLIITLGIVVDDAIVVGEHADYRYRTLGEPPEVAAERAARRMFLPVFTATLTTVIAFGAVMLIGGRFGQLIAALPYTVVAVLIASLIECFLILPNHMAHALKAQARSVAARRIPWYDRPSVVVNRGFAWVREQMFRPFTAWVLRLRYPVVAGALVLLSSQIAPVITGELGFRFLVLPERASVSGNFSMLPGATRAETEAQMDELRRATDVVAARFEAEHGTNPVTYVLLETGGSTGRGLPGAENLDADLLGSIAIELIDGDARPYTTQAFVEALQAEAVQLPLTETISFRRWRWGGDGGNLEVELYGADLRTLKAAAEDLKTRLAAYPEVSSISDDLPYDKDEFVLDLTPKGEALGFTIDALGRELRDRLNGIEAATYPAGMRTGRIRVEVPEAEKTADFLETMLLRTAEGQYVPLMDLVTVERSGSFATVGRSDGLAVVTVTGDLGEDDPARAAIVEGELREVVLPKLASETQISYRFAGQAVDEARFLSDARIGFILCLVAIFLVLAWVFASWTRPLAIMAVIPFALVGAFWGHQHWDMPLSMFSIVGLIGMTGIVINDSIVLIATIDEGAKKRGLWPAIIDGTAERLRPVLLTTLTTVFGLVPLLYEGSRQAEFLKPAVITLVYGLSFGMALVLILVPALLAIGQDVAQAGAGLRRGLRVRGARVRAVAWGYGVAALAWFSLTLGAVLWGATSPVLSGLGLPSGTGAAYGVFALGAIAAALVMYLGLVARHKTQQV